MNGSYGFAIATLKVLAIVALTGSIARGLVGFGRWRTSLRNRLMDEPQSAGGELISERL